MEQSQDFNERLTRAYIGKNHEEIYPKLQKNNSISLFGLIFGSLYFVYRKMYLYAVLYVLLLTFISSILLQ